MAAMKKPNPFAKKAGQTDGETKKGQPGFPSKKGGGKSKKK